MNFQVLHLACDPVEATVYAFALPHLQAPMLFGEDTPTLKFVEISATRIANQLTVIEHEVFQRITPL